MKMQALFLAALVAAVPVLSAQEEKKKAPEGAAMPKPKQKEHDALKAFVGTWDVTMKMEAMPGVPGMEKATEAQSTEVSELVCNGLWLKSSMAGTWNGEPCQGLWIMGYDPIGKTYVGHYVSSDSKDCGPSTFKGTYDAEAKTWTWTGNTPHGQMRTVCKVLGADKTVETCYVLGKDGSATKCMELTRKRSKKPAIVPASFTTPKKSTELPKEYGILLDDVGTWKTVAKMKYPGQEEPTEEEGTEKVTAICQGRWLWTDFEGTMMGMPFEGHALMGWDPNAKKYVSFWIDSMSAGYAKTIGTYDADKKTCILTGQCPGPTGKPMSMRQEFIKTGDDTRLLKMEFESEGKTSHMQILYSRKK